MTETIFQTSVLSSRLKDSTDEAVLMLTGNVFHAEGPATVKERSPNLEHRTTRYSIHQRCINTVNAAHVTAGPCVVSWRNWRRRRRDKSTQATTQSTQWTQRPKLEDRSGVYYCVASVALPTLCALRWMEAKLYGIYLFIYSLISVFSARCT